MEGENASKAASSSQVINPLQHLHSTTMRAKIYSREEWDARKETIRFHYCVKQKKLHEVVTWFREEEGFFATEKQFKDRIRAWGFDKKIKMHEMKAIIRKRRLRRQQGKESRFEVRGQLVDEAKINRSSARYGTSPNSSPGPATPREVSCYTPPREESPVSLPANLPDATHVKYLPLLDTPHTPVSKPSPPKLHISLPTEQQSSPYIVTDSSHPNWSSPPYSSPANFSSYPTHIDPRFLRNDNPWSEFGTRAMEQYGMGNLSSMNEVPLPNMTNQSSYIANLDFLPFQSPVNARITPPTSISSATPSENAFAPTRSRSLQVKPKRSRPATYTVTASPHENQNVGPSDTTQPEGFDPRPWKCSFRPCEYHDYGWRTKKELIRHENLEHKHMVLHKCPFDFCPYQSRYEANCQEHMEKVHGWIYARTMKDAPLPKTPGNSSKRYRGHEEDELSSRFAQLHISHGMNYVETIHTLDELATVLKTQGQYVKAEKMAKKVEQATIETLGKTKRETLSATLSRIDALACQGQYVTARAEVEALLQSAKVILGPYDCLTVCITSLMSKILYALGAYKTAEALASQVFHAAALKKGPYHSDTLAAKAFWAVVLLAMNRATEGELLLRAVLRDYHPDDKLLILDRKGDLAYACAVQRKYRESENLEREVLKGQTSLLGFDHPNTLKTVVRLARTIRLQARFEEAEEMLMAVLETQVRVLGEESKELLVTWEEIGRCLRLMGEEREVEAMAYLVKAGSPLL